MNNNPSKTLAIQELFSKSLTLTITSLEIAERIGKNHFHVLRDIKTDLAGLSERVLNDGQSKFGFTQNDSQQLQEGNFLNLRKLKIISDLAPILHTKVGGGAFVSHPLNAYHSH